MAGRYDSAYKRLIGHPEMIRDLAAFLPVEASEPFDWDTVEPLSPELIGENGRQRYADTLWKVGYRKSAGRPVGAYALLVLEFQSDVDRRMARRMGEYAMLAVGRLEAHGRTFGDGELPLAMPVVVYTGERRWTAPRAWRLALARGVALEYWLVDVLRLRVEDMPRDNRVSVLFRLELAKAGAMDPWLSELLQAKDELARLVGGNRALADDFNHWASTMGLQQVVESKETGMLAERVAKIKAEYGAQAWNEGFVIGERDLLRRLAEHHFGPATANRLAALLENESDAERLAEVGCWMLECDTGEELVRRVER